MQRGLDPGTRVGGGGHAGWPHLAIGIILHTSIDCTRVLTTKKKKKGRLASGHGANG